MEHRRFEHKEGDFVVHLLWAELEYDVKYGIAKRTKMSGIKGEEKKNFVFSKEDTDWLLRTISTALGKVKSKLKCSVVNNSSFASDELLEIPMEYNIVFHHNKDEEWLGHPDNLMNAIHAYVATYCLAEYFSMADNTTANMLYAKAEEHLNDAYTEVTSVILSNTPKFIL